MYLDPRQSVFSADGDHRWVPSEIEGLSTEDPEIEDKLSNEKGFLTFDGILSREDDEIVLRGDGELTTGDTAETRIPIDAVELEWSCDIDEYRNRYRHEWSEYWDSDEVFVGPPTLDLLESGVSSDESHSSVEEILEDFAEQNDKAEIENQLLMVEDRFVSAEGGAICLGFHDSSTIIRDVDLDSFSIVDEISDIETWDDFWSLAGAHEHICSDGPFLVYKDDTIEVTLG